jgi:hypothetical protein
VDRKISRDILMEEYSVSVVSDLRPFPPKGEIND